MDMIEIAADLIDEDKDQPRYQFDEEALQELMSSIEEIGLLSPIKVRTTSDGRYKIIYGNRRYKACMMLGRKTIPCIVSTVTDELEIYLEQIAENLTREGFSPIEEAEAFDKLLHNPKFNSSIKFLAGKLGKPEAYIKKKCELLKFGPAVKKLIVSGTEIRKDKLTEDQLLPLKDLAMEHRDPLALIVARDELPVSDVKKIAKLFKDPGISDGTKGKLLYKSGYELLETWSVFEHNRKEREKTAAARLESANDRKQPLEVPSEAAATGMATVPQEQPEVQISQSEETRVETKLRQLLDSLTARPPLSADELGSLHSIPEERSGELLDGLDALIGQLDSRLAEWRAVRDRVTIRLKTR